MHVPPAESHNGDWSYAWCTFPHRDHVDDGASGDRLFVEDDRQDRGMLFLLVDVPDHGPSADEVAARLGEQLSHAGSRALGPVLLLRRLNSWWAATKTEQDPSYIAAMSVHLSSHAREILVANAGHPNPSAVCRDGVWELVVDSSAFPLGIVAEWAADVAGQILTSPGSPIMACFCSDGIPEAAGANGGGLFGKEAMRETLSGCDADAGPAVLRDTLVQAVRDHSGPNWPSDDTTVLCVRSVESKTSETGISGSSRIHERRPLSGYPTSS